MYLSGKKMAIPMLKRNSKQNLEKHSAVNSEKGLSGFRYFFDGTFYLQEAGLYPTFSRCPRIFDNYPDYRYLRISKNPDI
jgi:hypothetical protein